MLTLHETLWELRNEDLSMRLKMLDLKPEKPTKAPLIDALKAAYAGDGLRRIWNSLSEVEQAAIAEAAYDPFHVFEPAKVRAKYGGDAALYVSRETGRPRRPFGGHETCPTRLHLLLFSAKDISAYYIPDDLAERLRQFVPEPSQATPDATEEPPKEEGMEIRVTPQESVLEVMALLRLAESGEFRVSDKTAMPSAAGGRKILPCLPMGDFYPPEVAFRSGKKSWAQEIGAIKPVAWARLLHNAGYVDVRSPKSKLTRKGIKALSVPPHETIRDLWVKWVEKSPHDEFNRVEAIKGQRGKGNPMTDKMDRRLAVIDALWDCPVGKWIDTENFSHFMIAADHNFEVARVPSRLYFGDPHYGNLGYAGFGEWNILQYRYILCFLFEYAATLGLVDVAYVHPKDAIDDLGDIWGADELEWLSRYDGLRAFRLTELGAYCLGITDDFVPALPESTLQLEVGTRLVIRRKAGILNAADRLLLESWADPVDTDTWRLNLALARQAIERGQKAEEFAEFLRTRDPQPLPQTVEGFLEKAERDGRAVRTCGEAMLFECRDAETANLICSHKDLKNICHPSGGAHITVLAPHAEKFRNLVRNLGLGVI